MSLGNSVSSTPRPMFSIAKPNSPTVLPTVLVTNPGIPASANLTSSPMSTNLLCSFAALLNSSMSILFSIRYCFLCSLN